MNDTSLSVVGLGTYLPPTRNVRETARSNGGDDSEYRGWEKACQGGPDDHPSTMGTLALKEALERADLQAADLSLLLFTGTSRDYVPSWSVSAEIMKRCGATDECLGMDMTAGCLATLAALEFARSWLAARAGGYAAIIAAERWSQSLDYKDPTARGLWSYGDSAGAIVVASKRRKGVPRFLGAEFRSAADGNGGVLIPYGGTREPIAPPGASALARRMSGKPPKEITAKYRKGYGDAFTALRQRFPMLRPAALVCNQMSPQIVGMLCEMFDLKDNNVATGNDYGHLGGVDVIVGIQRELRGGKPRFPILIGASTAYGFGTGLVAEPD